MLRTTIITLGLLALLSAGCAPGANPNTPVPDERPDLAGFWRGLWQGFIALFSFVVSLFRDDVRIYEVHNAGKLYDLGYLLGVMMFFGGGGKAGWCSRKK